MNCLSRVTDIGFCRVGSLGLRRDGQVGYLPDRHEREKGAVYAFVHQVNFEVQGIDKVLYAGKCLTTIERRIQAYEGPSAGS
jgi:hypothetical protein